MSYADHTVAEIATTLPGATAVFRAHRIDYCCGGGHTLAEAWAALQRLCAAFPDDGALAARLTQLEQGLDPAERRRVAMTRKEPTGAYKSPMHDAEALAAAGRYKEAIVIYRALLAHRPDWDLVKERLAA